MAKHLHETALVMIETLFGLIVRRTYVDYNITGIENCRISGAFQLCGIKENKRK